MVASVRWHDCRGGGDARRLDVAVEIGGGRDVDRAKAVVRRETCNGFLVLRAARCCEEGTYASTPGVSPKMSQIGAYLYRSAEGIGSSLAHRLGSRRSRLLDQHSGLLDRRIFLRERANRTFDFPA